MWVHAGITTRFIALCEAPIHSVTRLNSLPVLGRGGGARLTRADYPLAAARYGPIFSHPTIQRSELRSGER